MACSEQVGGAHANEIKHDHQPEVIVVFDSRYDESYKDLHIYSRSIAISVIILAPLLVCPMLGCRHSLLRLINKFTFFSSGMHIF